MKGDMDMDNKDWLNDYMSLKQVNPDCPFTVPVGYFDELHQRTMSRAALDKISENGDGFAVPENLNPVRSVRRSYLFVDYCPAAKAAISPTGTFE